jgi:tRNA 2-selenouridine synthase
MHQDISAEKISDYKNTVFIDVRSEQEYCDGTIPGAVNVPLFNNEERKEIGTIYSQVSPKKARERGLELASVKLPSIYRQVTECAGGKPVTVFCWRGGMRSGSVAMFLSIMGLKVFRIDGGYQAYRRYVTDYFDRRFSFQVVVIRGNTGTGKTELIQRLKREGYPAIDLEGLSNNRGSVFGGIGLGSQPTQKQFEALLYEEINHYRDFPYLIMECESKRIGRVVLPQRVFSAMQEGIQVLLYDSLPNRVARLVQQYSAVPGIVDELQLALEKLTKRLGKKNIENLVGLLKEKKYEKFAEHLILQYYDNLYGYPNKESDRFSCCISNADKESGFNELTNFLNTCFSIHRNNKN